MLKKSGYSLAVWASCFHIVILHLFIHCIKKLMLLSDDVPQAFTDSHMLMSTLGAKNEDLTMKLLDSLRKYVRYVIGNS